MVPWPIQVNKSSSTSIGSAVVAQLMVMSNRHIDIRNNRSHLMVHVATNQPPVLRPLFIYLLCPKGAKHNITITKTEETHKKLKTKIHKN